MVSEKEELTINSVGGVHGNLVLSCLTNQAMSFFESHIRWCGTVPQIIGYDLHPITLPNSHT